MFRKDAGVFQGHVPAAEVDHSGAMLAVDSVQRCLAKFGCCRSAHSVRPGKMARDNLNIEASMRVLGCQETWPEVIFRATKSCENPAGAGTCKPGNCAQQSACEAHKLRLT